MNYYYIHVDYYDYITVTHATQEQINNFEPCSLKHILYHEARYQARQYDSERSYILAEPNKSITSFLLDLENGSYIYAIQNEYEEVLRQASIEKLYDAFDELLKTK